MAYVNDKSMKTMDIEYEATFLDVKRDEIRGRLRAAGAKLIKPDFLMKRTVFGLPSGHEIPSSWLRVRDEGDKITMSLKIIDGDKIEDQKEICLQIDNFEQGVMLLETLGAQHKAYQETRRELWTINDVEVTIDEWPYLEPYVEVEGKSETDVKAVSELLGFNYSEALFCSVDFIYNQKYGTPIDTICNHTPRITFTDPNPFL